ncbi:hypothetical protein V6N11_035535 [Hibiscus sabdariffa]|uniref:Cell growth-regulating nucleolar protein-like winged helix domain-containing protein n=1 Tax=Hibiscus sabdariffa TaxID=183260 RepID=A0ABR2R0U5_9ROSI
MKTGEPKHSTERTMFFEDDQENLYKLVQDKATTGKQGLGIKDRPKKIAGVHFQGKKTSFSDSEAEDSDDVGPPPKRMRCNALETEKADEPKLKLKKLCKRLLRQVPGDSLKLKRLKVLIDEQSSSVFSDFSSKKDAIAYLKRKLEGSSKFSVEGKRSSQLVETLTCLMALIRLKIPPDGWPLEVIASILGDLARVAANVSHSLGLTTVD